jgi:hypothetical protein
MNTKFLSTDKNIRKKYNKELNVQEETKIQNLSADLEDK